VTKAMAPSAIPEPPVTAPETLVRSSRPIFRLWRRILPTFGPLDLSPVVGVVFLYILSRVIVSILNQFH